MSKKQYGRRDGAGASTGGPESRPFPRRFYCTATQTTIAKDIFDKLNELAGNIEDFQKRGADDTYKARGYRDFGINCLSEQRVMFGFWKEINDDSCPDPAFSIALANGEAVLDALVMDTMLGYFQGAENAAYCPEFLMVKRKQNGIMRLVESATA